MVVLKRLFSTVLRPTGLHADTDMTSRAAWCTSIARVTISSVLGGAVYILLGAIFAANEWASYIRFQRARLLGEHSFSDISWWFTERMAAWQLGNQAPSYSFDTWSDRADVLVVRIVAAPAPLRWLEMHSTFATWGVVVALLLGSAIAGVTVGGAAGFLSRRSVALACPARALFATIVRSAHSLVCRGALYGGLLGGLGWYLGFDRGFTTRGLEYVFALPWEGLAALVPLCVWAAVESARHTRLSIRQCAVDSGRCWACGYPSHVGPERRCCECGKPQVMHRTIAGTYRSVGLAGLCVIAIAVAFAVKAWPDHHKIWPRWLAGHSEFMPRSLVVWYAPGRLYRLENGSERLLFRMVERGSDGKAYFEIFSDSSKALLLRTVPFDDTIVHGMQLGRHTVRVRGPWSGAIYSRVYCLELDSLPTRFEVVTSAKD